MSEIQKIIVTLNSIKVGDLDLIMGQLDQIKGVLAAGGLEDKAEILQQAQEALRHGQIPGFRKLIARATAELGHCKHRGLIPRETDDSFSGQ